MRRVFVYEYLSGGGAAGDPEDSAELMPMGVGMRDAMALDLLCSEDCAVTVATCAQAPLRHAGARQESPRHGERPLDFVLRQAGQHDAVWLVAPETGGLLADFARQVPPSAWLGCSPAAIMLASSKRATVEHLAAHGIATPLAWRDDPEVRRWVVKPDDGAGALDSLVHHSLAAARRDLDHPRFRPAPGWLEPWVEGEALSVSMLCRNGHAELLGVNRQHIEIGADGALRYAGVDVDVMARDDARRAALVALVNEVARAVPGLYGVVGIDLVWHARRGPVLIEINPRVTCAYVGLSASLGRNIAAELLAWRREEVLHG